MAESGRQEPLTGFGIFYTEMVQMLRENGLQNEATNENLLDAFFSLDEEFRQNIDKMAATGYRALPRHMCERLRSEFLIPTTQRSQPAFNDQRSGSAVTLPPSSRSATSTGHLTPTTPQSPSGFSAVERPVSVSGGDLFAPASPFVCSAGCLDTIVFGGDNFVALRHPSIPDVYLKLPIEALTETEMQPTAVPLIYDQLPHQDDPLKGHAPSIPSAAHSVPQEPRMTPLIATLGNASTVMADLIKVVKGIIHIYDMESNSWKHLWGS